METYTLSLFYNGQREIQREEFQAMSATGAYNSAAVLAKNYGASHFNVNLGRIDREIETVRKR